MGKVLTLRAQVGATTQAESTSLVDEAYRTKYGRYRSNYVRPMISDTVAETTLQLQPTIS